MQQPQTHGGMILVSSVSPQSGPVRVSTTFELELSGTNDAVSGTIWNSLYQQTNEQLAPIDSRRLRLVLSLCYGSAAGIAGFPSLSLSFAPFFETIIMPPCLFL